MGLFSTVFQRMNIYAYIRSTIEDEKQALLATLLLTDGLAPLNLRADAWNCINKIFI